MFLARAASAVFAPIALSTALLAAPQGDVWVVAAAGGDFTQIQSAVDAAQDGDVILVKPGTYTGFHIVGTSLTVVADQPGTVTAFGSVRISGLAADRQVALVDLSVTATPLLALKVSDCQGAVRVRGGTWKTSTPPSNWGVADLTAVDIVDSPNVSFSGVTVQGADGRDAVDQFHGPDWGGGGIRSVLSRVAVHHSTLRGGDGGSDIADEGDNGGWGGTGFLATDGFAHLASLECHGGDGGNGGNEDNGIFFEEAGDGGNGGDGVRLTGSPAGGGTSMFAQLVALAASGGAAGSGGFGFFGPDGQPGVPGQALSIVGATVASTLPGPVKRLTADGLWRSGVPETITFVGTPGDLVFLVVSTKAGFRPVPGKQGVLLLGGMPSVQPLGAIGPGGTLSTTILPTLPAGWDGRVLHLQAWLAQPDGQNILTGPSTTTIVDPAF